jgi:cell division transport system permease protein
MQLGYFIKEAFRGFFQAKFMTFISVVTIGFTLFFLGCVLVTYINIHQWLTTAATRVDAVVFIEDPVSNDPELLNQLIANVKRCSEINTVVLVDKKEAWERFRKQHGDEMLTAVSENPFPASLELTLKLTSQTESGTLSLKKKLEAIKGMEDIKIMQQWVVMLQRFRKFFFVATLVVSGLLLFALHFMIANTIKLTIYARRELVRNMHFVGATDFYIKMPFILEGILQGVVGSCIGLCAMLVVKTVLSHFPVLFGAWYLFPVIFPLAGALFGCIGSMSAVRKFLVS